VTKIRKECLVNICYGRDRCEGVIDRAHLKTRGSGASWDEEMWVYLCRKHHTEQGAIAFNKFLRKYPYIETVLDAKGWELQTLFGITKLRKK
jgi:hypothetical protein